MISYLAVKLIAIRLLPAGCAGQKANVTTRSDCLLPIAYSTPTPDT